MCISGDVYNLTDSQWAVALAAQKLYRQVVPIIADGVSQRTGPEQTSYRHPRGWQAVLRVARNGWQALAVVHTFAEPPKEPFSISLPEGKWRIAGSLHAESKSPVIRGNKLHVPLSGDYRGGVVHLIRKT